MEFFLEKFEKISEGSSKKIKKKIYRGNSEAFRKEWRNIRGKKKDFF